MTQPATAEGRGGEGMEKIQDIPINLLLLDEQNPRLASRVENNDQGELVKILWDEMAVDEVALSIAQNGFFRSEPLFVIRKEPAQSDPTKQLYITVEGNRRLAAVLLLRDSQLRKAVGATDLSISESRRAELGKLPAIVYPDRRTLWTTVGFRHINGIRPWDSFSKAKYVADVHEQYGIPLAQIARQIGDRHSTVARLYRGYKLLEQAESAGKFAREDRAKNRFYFSHLYTAADQREFQEFLEIAPERSEAAEPVPPSKLDELEELMTWLYGKRSEHKEPIVRSQNPDLNYLREVISKPDSLSALRSGYPLERCLEIAIGDRRRFREALTRAKVELQNAKGTVTTGYSGEDDLYDTAMDISRVAETLMDEMEVKRVGSEMDSRRGRRERARG